MIPKSQVEIACVKSGGGVHGELRMGDLGGRFDNFVLILEGI